MVLRPLQKLGGDSPIVSTYGASNSRGYGIGIVLESPEGIRVEHSLRLGF